MTAQENKKSFNLKKGQVLDIIFLNQNPNKDDLLQEYFKLVFPVAQKNGYNPQPGFGVEKYTQGNYHPQSMVFGYWNSFDSRSKFLSEIKTSLPDFHKRRRDLWSTFALTYWELKKDLSFEINLNKYNVVTAYWANESSSFLKFKNNWNNKAKQHGAVIKVELVNGASPFGYYYNPDYLIINEWENEASFKKFYETNLKMDHYGVKHVNQFILK
ncbi:hypothetical protein DKG77_13760 [Flagellimonas aquimarina]|uniref:Uncharacterized protein n=2 Tax=Flagellimonas aquimarina TaxID=2201895 RepID=A0A316KWB1_9FLAO|nr:hypothetical protein DKG77_13760 [Allomuricauda koreensis]